MGNALFGYYIDLDERGSFRADVRDVKGNTVFEVRGGDELGEDESSIFEDGFMKDKNDLDGLCDYLKDMGVIPADAQLLGMSDFERRLEEVGEVGEVGEEEVDVSDVPVQKIVIVMNGGVVQSVLSVQKGISVAVIDYDKQADIENGILVPQGDGTSAPAYGFLDDAEVVSAERIGELFGVVEQHVSIADMEASYNDCKGERVAKAVDCNRNKVYGGEIVKVSEHHVAQNQGKGTVAIHEKRNLDRGVVEGEVVNVVYGVEGRGVVEPRVKDKDRGLAR